MHSIEVLSDENPSQLEVSMISKHTIFLSFYLGLSRVMGLSTETAFNPGCHFIP